MVELKREAYLELFGVTEDLLQEDTPRNFDRKKLDEQFFNLAEAILRELGWECDIYVTSPQSTSSCYGSIRLPAHIFKEPNGTSRIQVSHFGNFVTMDGRPIRRDILASLMKTIEETGFTFIPLAILQEPYTGEFLEKHSFKTWEDRFFTKRDPRRETTPSEAAAQDIEREDILRLEKSDALHPECPSELDPELHDQYSALAEKVILEIGDNCIKLYDSYEPVPYFGELILPKEILLCEPPDPKHCFQRIIVSNFGLLATIDDSTWPIQPDIRSRLEKLITESGFHYIPYTTLLCRYSGKYHEGRFDHWFERYFGYS